MSPAPRVWDGWEPDPCDWAQHMAAAAADEWEPDAGDRAAMRPRPVTPLVPPATGGIQIHEGRES